MLNRRNLLMIGAAALPLAACGGLTKSVNSLPQYAQDVQDIVGALQKTVSGLAVPQSVVDGLAKAADLAAQIGSAASGLTGSTPTALLGSFGNVVQGLVASLGGSSASGTLGTVLQAVMAVLPTVLSVAGIALAAPRSSMSPEQGRLVLKAHL